MFRKQANQRRSEQSLQVQLATIREYQRVSSTIYSYQQLF